MAGAEGLKATPGGLDLSVEDFALKGVRQLRARRGAGAEQVELAGVGGGGVEPGGARCEAGYLGGFKVGEVRGAAVLLNPVEAAAVTGSREESVGGGAQGIDDVVVGAPEPVGSAGGGELVDVGTLRDYGVCR